MSDVTPLVSVITLSYNSTWLLDTVSSVLAQNYDRIEYIVSDDGSISFPDGKIRELYANTARPDWSLKIIRHQNNIGTVGNLNAAIRSSSGEYLIFVSGDDLLPAIDTVSYWVHEFQFQQLDVLIGYADVYDLEMKHRINRMPTRKQASLIKNLAPTDLYQKLCYKNFIFGCCTARTRKSIDTYGYFDSRFHLLEDYPMNLYLLRNDVKFGLVDRLVIKYRSGGTSASCNYNAVYEKDSDLLYTIEQSRYAKRSKRVLRQYSIWKETRKEASALFSIYYSKNLFCSDKILYCLRHPLPFLRQLCYAFYWRSRRLLYSIIDLRRYSNDENRYHNYY